MLKVNKTVNGNPKLINMGEPKHSFLNRSPLDRAEALPPNIRKMKACNFQTEANIDHLIFVQPLRTQSSKIQTSSMVRMSRNVSLGLFNPRIATPFLRAAELARQKWRSENPGIY